MTAPRRHDVVMTTYAFEPGFKAGGPVKSVAELLDRLDGKVSCLLVTSDRDLGDALPYPGLSGRLVDRGGHQVLYVDRGDPRHWWRALRLVRAARPDVLYLNSFFSPLFTVLPVLATLVRVIRPRAVLLAPRGELSPGALGLKSRKKERFLRVWSRVLRRVGATFHASTELEAQHVRAVLPWARSVVQVNSAGPPPRPAPVPPRDDARFVFVSRISPKKNLELALAALARVRVPVTLDVYGPVEDTELWARCRAAIAAMPPHVTVRHRGPVAPADVGATFARYDAFVFPTLGENFGHVIAEALAAGCPVLCSPETPWSDVLADGGGTVVPSFDVDAWAAVLDGWASRDAAWRAAAKKRALGAFTRWRDGLSDRLAVEVALDEVRGGARVA